MQQRLCPVRARHRLHGPGDKTAAESPSHSADEWIHFVTSAVSVLTKDSTVERGQRNQTPTLETSVFVYFCDRLEKCLYNSYSTFIINYIGTSLGPYGGIIKRFNLAFCPHSIRWWREALFLSRLNPSELVFRARKITREPKSSFYRRHFQFQHFAHFL